MFIFDIKSIDDCVTFSFKKTKLYAMIDELQGLYVNILCEKKWIQSKLTQFVFWFFISSPEL